MLKTTVFLAVIPQYSGRTRTNFQGFDPVQESGVFTKRASLSQDTCDTYHSQLAWTFCFRTFPFTLSRLKLSSGLGTMRYIALCSSTREEKEDEEEERGKGGTPESRRGKERRKENNKKTTKDR